MYAPSYGQPPASAYASGAPAYSYAGSPQPIAGGRPLPPPKLKKKAEEPFKTTLGGVADLDGAERHILESVLLEEGASGVKWSDVAGLDFVKQTLTEMVIGPTANPRLFSGLRAQKRGILLFGPPGNGKTFIAKALANETNSNFFFLTQASLSSKYMGESEKILSTVFKLARKLSAEKGNVSIIFIDEIDACTSTRGEGQSEVSLRSLTQLLQEMDGLKTDVNEKVLVMGATNFPFAIDEAVLRRMPKKIYVPLADEDGRRNIMETILLKNENQENQLSDRELIDISRRTEGYSAADLSALLKESAMSTIRGYPIEELERMTAYTVPPLTYGHIKNALNHTRAATNLKDIKALEDWHLQFGAEE